MEETNKPGSIFEFSFTEKLKGDIRMAAIWARVVAIFSFIASAITLLNSMRNGSLFFACIMTAISVTVSIYLFNFGAKTKKGIENVAQDELEEGLNDLRSYFKISGIVLLVVMIIVFLIITIKVL